MENINTFKRSFVRLASERRITEIRSPVEKLYPEVSNEHHDVVNKKNAATAQPAIRFVPHVQEEIVHGD